MSLTTEKQGSALPCVTDGEKDENRHVDLRMSVNPDILDIEFGASVFIRCFVLKLLTRIRSVLQNQWLKRNAELLISAHARS